MTDSSTTPQTMTVATFSAIAPGCVAVTLYKRLVKYRVLPVTRGRYLITDLERASGIRIPPRAIVPPSPSIPTGAITIRDFLAIRPDMTKSTMFSRLARDHVVPVVQGRAGVSAYYRADDLERAASIERQDNHRQNAYRPVAPSWVPHKIGARIRVTNVAGLSVVGIFAGYKGGVLARIKLGKEESVFATDAKVEAVPDTVPIDDWHIEPAKTNRFVYEGVF